MVPKCCAGFCKCEPNSQGDPTAVSEINDFARRSASIHTRPKRLPRFCGVLQSRPWMPSLFIIF